MSRTQVDDDLLSLPLTIDKAARIMEIRRERKELEKRIQRMHDSYRKRRKPHDDRVEELDAEEASIRAAALQSPSDDGG